MSATPSGKLRNVPVLCVSEAAPVLDGLTTCLRGGGFPIVELGLIRSQFPGLAVELAARVVILDIDDPDRAVPRYLFSLVKDLARVRPDIRVILLDGIATTDRVSEALESGAWGYLSKNESTEAWLRTIDRVLDGEIALSPDAERAFAMGQRV